MASHWEEPLPDELGHWFEQTQTLEQLRHMYEQTKNPLYAWEAIARRLNAGEPIPEWCVPYLHDVAVKLTHLALGHDSSKGEINPDQALRLVPQALSLSAERKTNKFAALQKDRHAVVQAAMASCEIESIAPFIRKVALKALVEKKQRPPECRSLDRASRWARDVLALGKRLTRSR